MATAIETTPEREPRTPPYMANETAQDSLQEPVEQTAEETAEETVQAAAAVTGKKNAAAPNGPGNRETFIAGDQGPEIGAEERQRRAAILAAHLREIDEDDARLAVEERRKKTEDAPQGPQKERTRLGSIYQRHLLQIDAQDSFFSVKGGTMQPGSPTPQMSNSQLKSLIMTAALEKNWHTLYFYKDRSTIDPTLTARAQQMIMELQRPGQPLEGFPMRVSSMRMRDVEPWNEGRPLYSMFRNAANYRDDTVMGIKNDLSSRWNSVVTGMMFKDAPVPAKAPAPQPGETDAGGTTVKAGPAADEREPAATVRRATLDAGPGSGR